MAVRAMKDEVDDRRELLRDLAAQSMRTENSVNRLSIGMHEFKDEIRSFKDEAERDRKRMNKQWGELAN
jgi:hypothetical protein